MGWYYKKEGYRTDPRARLHRLAAKALCHIAMRNTTEIEGKGVFYDDLLAD